MSKLYFFDIDGTLVDCENGIYEITQSSIASMDQLKKQGDDVFLATGRCKCFILDEVMKYPFSGYVTCNGAYVEYNNECVYKKVIPTEAIIKTHELCLQRGMSYYFEGNDYIYILDRNNPSHQMFKDEWGMKDEVIIDDYDPYTIETYIGMIVLNDESDIPYIVDTLSDYFDIQRHQHGLSFDLTLKGESKAKGIRELVKKLNKDMSDTIAFGDGRNDIEMLSEVGYGIAMSNGAPETKAIAKYVTKSVNEDGITYALKELNLFHDNG